jgi:hypothetical protein
MHPLLPVPYVAPDWVYATADEMEQSETLQPNFNLMSCG